MHHQLTSDVYWGDRHAPAELAGVVKLIVCVAEQADAFDATVSGKIPTMRLPIPDHVAPDAVYFNLLQHAISAAIDTSRLPVLVHCHAGLHRGPHVAWFMASAIAGYAHGIVGKLESRILELLPQWQRHAFGRGIAQKLWEIERDERTIQCGWFSHSGELGDIIYALPAIRACGGGTLYVFRQADRHCRMRREHFEAIRPLLLQQPYVNDVKWWNSWEAKDCPLNQFRRNLWPGRSIAQASLTAVGKPHGECERAWLTVDRVERVAPVVFGRGMRWRNPQFPWKRVRQKYGKDAVFLGTQEEWEDFCCVIDAVVRWRPTADLLEAARIIAGADLFVGNQSCLYAIAEGLKRPAVLEVDIDHDDCRFVRPGVTHGQDATVDLPDLVSRGCTQRQESLNAAIPYGQGRFSF